MNLEKLEELKIDKTPDEFLANYENSPISSEFALFKLDKMSFYDPQEFIAMNNLIYYGFCDPSLGKKDTSDYSAFITIAVDSNGIIYVVDAVVTPKQKEVKQRITEFRRHRAAATKPITKTLTDFFGEEKEDLMTMLSGFIEGSRLEKAREIKEIEIIESGGDKIVADVNGYSVYIDLEKRFMLHDCVDWKWISREKRFCKHIGALLLALPKDKARLVLESVKGQWWEFSQYTGRGDGL